MTMVKFSKGLLAVSMAFASLSGAVRADAGAGLVRWTGTEDADGSVAHVIGALARMSGQSLSEQDFILQEDRDLAFNHYRRLVQTVKGTPIHGRSIRIWTELGSDKAIQVEALLDAPSQLRAVLARFSEKGSTPQELKLDLTAARTAALAREAVLANAVTTGDTHIRGITSTDEFVDGELVRFVKVRGKRGTHLVTISLRKRKVIATEYREFPQADQAGNGGVGNTLAEETSVPVQVFPIYEETAGDDKSILPRVSAELKHVLKRIASPSADIYGPLKEKRYFEDKHDFTLGATSAGQALGFWSMAVIKHRAAQLVALAPQVDNSFANGLLLQGRYTSINIHPDALTKFGPLDFTPRPGSAFLPNWVETNFEGKDLYEMVPGSALAGKPLFSAQEALDRPARRLPDHDPKAYLNDGFDELQVYYGVDTLFEELQARGWKDPELSTRPFNAFLFNPDISMKDNAFYTDDTINFTTYSPKAQNFARDNSTIWHELGHGVMDRLMGDSIELADTGGLSEGMADFVAAMVIQAVTHGTPFAGSQDFRIINKMGFNLTNEVHDDGESYGGTMKDFMDAVIAHNPQTGLEQVVDVVLEAMRLTRDYPGLTAADWFKHILFADQLGRTGLRAPGELSSLLLASLASRNFKIDGGPTAAFSIVNSADGQEVVAGKPGSRNRPILTQLPKDGTADFELKASVKNSDQFSFKFPVQVRVQFTGGPIQGAIHWTGEEQGAKIYTINSEADVVKIPLQVTGTCDFVNRDDGSCVDFAYVQIINAGETRPAAKKRFYLQVK